jgi:hypothetical protein
MDDRQYKEFLEWLEKKENESAKNKTDGYNPAYCDGRMQMIQDVKGYLEFIDYNAEE